MALEDDDYAAAFALVELFQMEQRAVMRAHFVRALHALALNSTKVKDDRFDKENFDSSGHQRPPTDSTSARAGQGADSAPLCGDSARGESVRVANNAIGNGHGLGVA